VRASHGRGCARVGGASLRRADGGWTQLPWLRWREGRGTEAGLKSSARGLQGRDARSLIEPKDYHDLVRFEQSIAIAAS